jgi:hypothetical protein
MPNAVTAIALTEYLGLDEVIANPGQPAAGRDDGGPEGSRSRTP